MFEDGTEVNDIDVIIFATGYQVGFPCLEKSLVPVENNKVPLYKYVFPYHHLKSTMAILGCVQPIGALMPLSELQARWAVKVFKGERSLPSKEQMRKDVDEKLAEMNHQYYKSNRHTIQVSRHMVHSFNFFLNHVIIKPFHTSQFLEPFMIGFCLVSNSWSFSY